MRVSMSSLAFFLLSSISTTTAFTISTTSTPIAFSTSFRSTSHATRTTLNSSDNNSAFTAFAERLEEDSLFDDNNNDSSDESVMSSWQESLEELLDPKTSTAKKQILLSDLMGANEDIRNDVVEALKERKIDPILTPTGKKLQDGTRAVARQVTTDILPGIASAVQSSEGARKLSEDLPTLIPKIGDAILEAVSTQARKQLELLQGDLADPSRIPNRISKQTADIATEARNVFLETPEGLAGPEYKVVSKGDGYEVREYVGYTAASTSMSKVGEQYALDDLTSSGAAFNAIAAYLFGANDEERSLEMTTPVTTTSLGEMRFYLKKNGDDDTFPNPVAAEDKLNEKGAVKVVDVAPARLAVARFTGFVTDGEVARQKDALLSALAIDGVEIDVPHGAVVPYCVFQYNPPYTIPIVRRNELAIPVRANGEGNPDIKNEWSSEGGELEEEQDVEAPSDVE
eukprot:CAMPEP_0195525586 /NCGR_PEP_ID=MMETSP0794_2-20130614/26078_1 /TAXON_ID=515487 /ORGANISM="Stephanopyxis turris, Strain CCMP 815" /LENGTH=456 /DNA_ID=CAMNT_0040656073 /DNA_START=69 /DNA_END=1439 /DNA_ORIENTATION=+